MTDVLLDALLDTLKIAPVIIIMHVVIELVEHRFYGKLALSRVLFSPFAPAVGAAVGAFPQCGFSVVAVDLYSRRRIGIGTLLAVVIATSDEAIPVLLGEFHTAYKVLPLLGCQLALALVVGYAASLIFLKQTRAAREAALAELPARNTARPVLAGNEKTPIKSDEKIKIVAEPADVAELASANIAAHSYGDAESGKTAADTGEKIKNERACEISASCDEIHAGVVEEDSERGACDEAVECDNDKDRNVTHENHDDSNEESGDRGHKHKKRHAHGHEHSAHGLDGHSHGGHGEHGEEAEAVVHGCHGHAVTGEHGFRGIALHTLRHAGTVLVFVLIVNIAFGAVLKYVGEERFVAAMTATEAFQPFVVGLIGLIPNCAASVVVARLYALGGITLGAAVAGLGAGAGIAYAVLFKENKHPGKNIAIVAAVYAICSVFGTIIELF